MWLISVWPRDSETPKLENIFLTETGRTSQGLQDMLQSTPTWALSSPEETIWSLWASSWCTSTEEVFLGKDSLRKLRRKSTKRFETRSCPPRLKLSARGTPKNSQFTWTTAEVSNSRKSLTLVIWGSCSRIYSIEWVMSMTSFSTGWSRNRVQPLRPSLERKRRRTR